MLRTEQLLRTMGRRDTEPRTMGKSDIERGHEIRTEQARAFAPRGGRVGVGRPRAVVLPHMRGTFALCVLCELLVYMAPSTISPSKRVWHGPCWHAWRCSGVVSEWFHDRGLAVRNEVPTEVLAKFPLPVGRRGTPVRGEDLAAAYRALLGFRSGRTLADLAVEAEVTKQAILERVNSITNRLPASWDLVFRSASGSTAHPRNLGRQQLFPLPVNGPGQKTAATRMAGLGIPSDVIEQVTGVVPANPQSG
jgi:hypothetical protein